MMTNKKRLHSFLFLTAIAILPTLSSLNAQVLFDSPDGTELVPRFGLELAPTTDPLGEPAARVSGDPKTDFADLASGYAMIPITPELHGQEITLIADLFLPANSGLSNGVVLMRFYHDANGDGTLTFPSDEVKERISSKELAIDFGQTNRYQTVELKMDVPSVSLGNDPIDGVLFHLILEQSGGADRKGDVKAFVRNVMLYIGEAPAPPEPAEPE